MHKLFITFILVVLVSLSGCIKNPDGTMQPLSTLEVEVLARTSMTGAIHVQKMDMAQLASVEAGLIMARDTILLALESSPEEVPTFNPGVLRGLDPIYQDMIADIAQLALLRIRPFIDQENPDVTKAVGYTKAVFNGALTAINREKTRLSG